MGIRIRPMTMFIYFLLEILSFYALARWIGIGWTLLIIFACSFFGAFLGLFSLRTIAKRQSPEAILGDYTLTIIGSLLLAIPAPGVISSILGLLLIFPPTRLIIRKVITRKIYAKLNSVSEAAMASMARYNARRTSFGSFIDIDPEDPSSKGKGEGF